MMHREDAAWLAGLLDGEGCFDHPDGYPRVRVKMTDLDVVLRAAYVMPHATTHHEGVAQAHYKPVMVAQVRGEAAIAVMLAVLPWMGSRRSAKITEIVNAYTAKQSAKIVAIRARARLKAAA